MYGSSSVNMALQQHLALSLIYFLIQFANFFTVPYCILQTLEHYHVSKYHVIIDHRWAHFNYINFLFILLELGKIFTNLRLGIIGLNFFVKYSYDKETIGQIMTHTLLILPIWCSLVVC